MAIFNLGPNQDDFPGKNDDNKGDDVITGNADENELDGGPGDDQIFGGEDEDILKGGSGDDMLDGGDDDDVLDGGPDDDWLRGGKGADMLMGGPGIDVANYYESDAGVTVNLAGGIDHDDDADTDPVNGKGGTAQGDTLTGIENVQGSMYADMITGNSVAAGTEGVQSNDLFGWLGNDELTGGAGADKLRGHMGDDTIDGMGGDDWIRGGEGADVIDGGPGDGDTVSYVGAMGVTVDLSDDSNNAGGQAEGDTITNVENVTGTRHDDMLTGDVKDNRLEGNDGDDMLTGGAGADVLIGGEGNDTASYADSEQAVMVTLEGQSVDEDGNPDGPVGVGGDAAGDQFFGIENLIGSDGDDTLTGDDQANRLYGNEGGDTIIGGKGDDMLDGGKGDDMLTGGAGADMLMGGSGTDEAIYTGSDKAVMVDLAAGTGMGGDAEGDTLTRIENVTGSNHDDTL